MMFYIVRALPLKGGHRNLGRFSTREEAENLKVTLKDWKRVWIDELDTQAARERAEQKRIERSFNWHQINFEAMKLWSDQARESRARSRGHQGYFPNSPA